MHTLGTNSAAGTGLTCRREEIVLERIEDRFDQRVLGFCRAAALENGADSAYFDNDLTYPQTCARFDYLPPAQVEEIWKFGPRKWRQTRFANLECLVWNGRVIGVSGCRLYSGGLLRVSMHLYTLRPYRAVARNFQFTPGGLFERHLDYARSRADIHALFMTVYPHTKTLQAHARNLGRRRSDPSNRGMKYIYDLEAWPEPLLFHGVEQHFFFYPLNANFRFNGRVPEAVEP